MSVTPTYISTQKPVGEKRCPRCNHLTLIDYGRRADIVCTVGGSQVVVHIITSDYTGRCISCYQWFDWHPAPKRKSS